MSQCHDNYESDPLASAGLPILVRDLMTPDPVTVSPAATVKDIAHAMLEHDVRSLPVVDTGEVLVGVVDEADIICRECPDVSHHALGDLIGRVFGHDTDWHDKAEGVTAGELMSTGLVTCRPDEPAPVVARRMLTGRVRTLPVVDGGRLVGVVSRRDLLRLFDRPDQEIRARLQRVLTDPLWAPEGHEVDAEVADGVVRLRGSVRVETDRRVVAAVVAAVPGVIEVVNEVVAEIPVAGMAADAHRL